MPNHDHVGRGSVVRAAILTALVGGWMLAGLAGCSQHPMEPGFADQGRTQIQFYTPPGATVNVRACSMRSHEIAAYGPFENRLEQSPEEFCVFNLGPGRYEFKYTSAEGLPGVSLYGELIVNYANSHEARVFQRRAFVPLSLPSEHYKQVEVTGDEVYPYRGEAFRTAIDENDIQRLKLGDVVEKVLFVADLEQATQRREETISRLKVLERKMEYADARFRLAYQDFQIDVADPAANFWRTDRKFIGWEKERQELSMRYAALQSLLKRTQALLNGDHVLVRKGMLVLATEEVVQPHKDVVLASEQLGEVLLIMRIGGRHMQWGDPRNELAVYER